MNDELVAPASRLLRRSLASSQDASGLVWSRSSITNPSLEGVVSMADDGKSLGQTYYEEVEALKGTGISNAEAIRQVAAKYGKKENAIRGGIHQYKSRHVSGNGAAPTRSRARRSAPTVEDLVAQARQSLEQALAQVDDEVAQAKQQLDAAQAHYDDVVAAVKDRRADIEKKLQAMS